MAEAVFKPGQGYTKAEWDEVGDNPELTEEELAEMRPFAEVFPELAASIQREQELEKASGIKLISQRLSDEVIDRYRAGGADWQSRIDADLRRLNNIK